LGTKFENDDDVRRQQKQQQQPTTTTAIEIYNLETKSFRGAQNGWISFIPIKHAHHIASQDKTKKKHSHSQHNL